MHARDTVTDGNYRSDLFHRNGLLVILNLLAQYFCYLVCLNRRHSLLLSSKLFGCFDGKLFRRQFRF